MGRPKGITGRPWVKMNAANEINPFERQEQARCVKLLRTIGFTVWDLSQYRRANQTPGLPDLMAKHEGRGFAFTFEVKGQEGRLSKHQETFARLAARCGERHLIGGYDTLMTYLTREGFFSGTVPA
jgi:hypothetical protein